MKKIHTDTGYYEPEENAFIIKLTRYRAKHGRIPTQIDAYRLAIQHHKEYSDDKTGNTTTLKPNRPDPNGDAG